MRAPLRLAVAQPLCVPYDVAANAKAHAAAVRATGARVVVFPELSLTGYELDAPALSTDGLADDPRLRPLVEACAAAGTLALAGAPMWGAAGPHIAILAVDTTGVRVAYRKVYLGTSEATRFVPGDRPVVLDVDGWRLGMAVCKDTGTVQHNVDTAALGIDAYVAGTLMTVDETAEQDDRGARIARRHGVWVAFASFAGSTGDGYDDAAGCSAIWAPDGSVAVRAGRETGAIVSTTIHDSAVGG